MQIILSLVIGVSVGTAARLIAPSKDPGGLFLLILLGIAGSVVATFLSRAFNVYSIDHIGLGVLTSFLGSGAIVSSYRCFPARPMT